MSVVSNRSLTAVPVMREVESSNRPGVFVRCKVFLRLLTKPQGFAYEEDDESVLEECRYRASYLTVREAWEQHLIECGIKRIEPSL